MHSLCAKRSALTINNPFHSSRLEIGRKIADRFFVRLPGCFGDVGGKCPRLDCRHSTDSSVNLELFID